MTTQDLINITRTIKHSGLDYNHIVQQLSVGDYLCVMDNMRPVQDEEGKTLVVCEWMVYPITRKTKSSLYSGAYRWSRMDGGTNLMTTEDHVASCWVPRHEMDEFLSHTDSYTREDLYNRFIIKQSFWFQKPTFTVEE